MTNSPRKFLFAPLLLGLIVAAAPGLAAAQAVPAKAGAPAAPRPAATPAAAARPAVAPRPAVSPRAAVVNQQIRQQQFQQQVNQQQSQSSLQQAGVRQQIRQNNIATQRTNASDPALRNQLDRNEAARTYQPQPKPVNTTTQPASGSSVGR